MKFFNQVGPFGKAEKFVRGFVYNFERQRIFMDLLEEMDNLEEIISNDETEEEEKQVAEYLYEQLNEQFMAMITPVSASNDQTGTGKNL